MRHILVLLLSLVTTVARAETLGVVTWNLWHGFGPSARGFGPRESAAARADRVDRQTRILTALAPDVTFLQECNPLLAHAGELGRRTGAEWAGQLDAAGVKLFGFGLPWRLDAGLATLGRPRLRDLGAISLTNPRVNLIRPWASAQVREERFAHFAEVRLNSGVRVLLINTQLHDGVEFPRALRDEVDAVAAARGVAPAPMMTLRRRLARGDRRRRRELGHLLARARALEPGYDLTILAGDLNAAPTSDAADLLRATGYRDAWAEVATDEPGYTYDADASALNRALVSDAPVNGLLEGLPIDADARADLADVIGRFERRARRIDYVWVRSRGPRVTVISAARVGVDAPAAVASDHLGVAVDFAISSGK